MFFLTFFMYFLPASAVFSYGIGLNFLLSPAETTGVRFSFRLAKILPRFAFTAVAGTAALWFPASYFFTLPGIFWLLPPCVFFIAFGLNSLFSVAFGEEDAGQKTSGYVFLFSVIFLSLTEGVSFPDALTIAAACVLSFFFFLFLVVAVLERVSVISLPEAREGLPLYLISAGIFSLFAFVFDVMWGAHTP